MSLPNGTKLAHYEIVEPIGKGGMGEVYRAKDVKLGRDVAIKVLPDEFAENEERLARFQREAKVLASLNHPGIAAIHGVEESESIHYLVLELVPGETLAERIARGPIPVEDALQLTVKIAEALEQAHQQGIVHRDLKPANIKLTPEDKVKVLDFGLAKSFESNASDVDLSQSPTLLKDGTQTGVILGTAPYMSPEQARGKPVDKRTDIWAFGCLLFEALTGRLAFPGETVSDTIAALLTREPDWQELPRATPASIRVLLRRCVQKEPERRLRDIGDARLEIEDALSGASKAMSTEPGRAAPAPLWHRAAPWTAAILVAAAWIFWPSPDVERPVVRTSINLVTSDRTSIRTDISPDGTRIVYNAGGGGPLYLRRLDQDESTPIPGTEGGVDPFFSPDGEWVGFFADSQIKKVRFDGVGAVTLSEAGYHGASWSPDGNIVFTPTLYSSLMSISTDGGPPEELTTLDSDELYHLWPQVLPGGKAVLFTADSGGIPDESDIVVQSLETSEREVVAQGSDARYVSSGHLVYARGGTLYAVPFDLDHLEVHGEGVPVQVGVQQHNNGHVFAVSETGTLIYEPKRSTDRRVILVDLDGQTEPLALAAGPYDQVRFSPNGQQLALSTDDARIHLYELETERFSLLFDSVEDDDGTVWKAGGPIWSPDGTRFAVYAIAPGTGLGYETFIVSLDGRLIEHVFPNPAIQLPRDFSPDGTRLLYAEQDPNSYHWQIWEIPLAPTGEPSPLLMTSGFDIRDGLFSPDGRWLAYGSKSRGGGSGREVHVKPYEGSGGGRQISIGGGAVPVWSPDGRTVYYRDDGKMMAVSIQTEPTFSAGRPRLLFEGAYYMFAKGLYRSYDLSPDGQQFAMIESEERAPPQLHVVLNWDEELKRLAPVE